MLNVYNGAHQSPGRRMSVGLATNVPIYCDESLLAYNEALPAAGASNSACPKRLTELVNADWVD